MVKLITFLKPEILLLYFLAFFYSSDLVSQSYSGALIVQDSLSFPYYLHSNNNYSAGYSVADINGATETLSLVKFSWLEQEEIHQIEEDKVVYTRLNPESYDDFCKILFRHNPNTKSIDTEFSAVLSDNTSCGSGLIKLEDTKKLRAKLQKVQSKIEKNKLLKSLTSQDDRQLSIEKINDLLKLSATNYATQITLKKKDYIDFLFFRNQQKVVLTFDRNIPQNIVENINVSNGKIKIKGNIITLTKSANSKSSSIQFQGAEFNNYSFDIKINRYLNLRFVYPSEFTEASFIF